MVNGFEVDFYWPDLGLVVETDGWRYHRTPSAQTRDALRDQTHTASGLTPLRFSHYQVKYEPARTSSERREAAADPHARVICAPTLGCGVEIRLRRLSSRRRRRLRLAQPVGPGGLRAGRLVDRCGRRRRGSATPTKTKL